MTIKKYKGCKIPGSLNEYKATIDLDHPEWDCSVKGVVELGCQGMGCFECILDTRNWRTLEEYLAQPNKQREALERIEAIKKELAGLEEAVSTEAEAISHKEPELLWYVSVRDSTKSYNV